MLKLTRPEGTPAGDLHLSRRALVPVFFAGYAAAAVSANAQAQTIHTDEQGLICQSILIPGPDQPLPAYVARPNARGRFPTIIVIPEVFGLHEYIRQDFFNPLPDLAIVGHQVAMHGNTKCQIGNSTVSSGHVAEARRSTQLTAPK